MKKKHPTFRKRGDYYTMTIGSPTNRHTFKIDAADYESVRKFNWKVQKIPQGNSTYVYAVSDKQINGVRKRIYLHREIMQPGPDMMVDHKNFITTDCRRSNMRVCTRGENVMRSRKRSRGRHETPTTSKYKGVGISPQGTWRVAIRFEGNYIYGGTFDSEEEAARKADELMRHYQKEYAVLNFPGEDD